MARLIVTSMIGQRIRNYRIVREIGKGGMAVVYEAKREDIDSRAALKILRTEFANNEDIAARFLNEARAANRIEHPGIVRIFDYGREADGTIFLAMEYLEGETLYRRFRRGKQLAATDVVRLGRQIASALAAAHGKQVIHRDLKPENILIIPEPDAPGGERVKILDFGLAKLQSSFGSVRTDSNLLMGTPVYMSPEQCRSSRNATDRSDVYALGTILFELLAGRPPFVSKEPGEYIAMHMYQPAPTLLSLMPSAPSAMGELIDAMLDKTPERRPTRSEVAQRLRELGAALGDQPSAELSLRSLQLAGAVAPRSAPPPPASSVDGFRDTMANPLGVTLPAMAASSDRGQAVDREGERTSATPEPPAMPSSPPGMGERVLRRLRDAGRRSLPPALSPDVLWSLFLARARRRAVLTISIATLVLVVLPVGLFFLGRSSVKPNKLGPEVTTAARGPVAALAAPPRTELAPSLPSRPAEPPLPPPPSEVSAAVYQAERLARIGAANEAMKGLRRAIAKRSHPLLWSTLGQLACGKDKSAIANQALEQLVDDKPETRKARADLLLVCKSYDILENKSGKLIKLGGKKTDSLRLRPVR
jgi:serine/threonine protein kinase